MKKNLTKTYKFIYRKRICKHACLWHNMHEVDHQLLTGEVDQYTFANRAPKGYEMMTNAKTFFYYSAAIDVEKKGTLYRNHLTGPANEANITRAFVKYFTYLLNTIESYIKQNTKFSKDYRSKQIEYYKKELAIWTERYEKLKREGVYTYLELVDN